MLYDIRLRVCYDYQYPVAGSRQHLRVTPRRIAGEQQVFEERIDIDPGPDEVSRFTDFFGNGVHAVALREAHARLDVTMTARIDVTRPEPSFDVSPDPADMARLLAGVRSLGPDSPHHFLAGTPFAAPQADLTGWAAESLAPGVSVQALALSLARRIHADFTYDGQATDVTTTAAQAFALKRGVCQDFSHLMVAGLRGLGIPAGYVSGLIRTEPPQGQERLEGADAMHAWVRVWCGHEAGWQEFDPTNGIAVAGDHIVIGHGRDYGDVSPVLGVLKTAGQQTAHQGVDVIPLD